MIEKKSRQFTFRSAQGQEIIVDCCYGCPLLRRNGNQFSCKPNRNYFFPVPVGPHRGFVSSLDENAEVFLGDDGTDLTVINDNCPVFAIENFETEEGREYWGES